jgi:hypothetical protein
MTKRVKMTMLVADGESDHVKLLVAGLPGVGIVESYEESELPKDADITNEHSFDMLLEGAMDVANGVWRTIKGIGKLSAWAFVLIFEGLKWLWKSGVGKKDVTKKK